MSYLFGLFVNNLLPIFIIAGAGFWLTKYRQVDPRALSQVIFFLFTPCLIFDLMTHTLVGGTELLHMAFIVVGSHLVVGVAALLVGKALGFPRSLTIALVIASMLPNSGNYGLATVKFAFGEAAMAHASLYFANASVMLYTAGVFVASMGTSTLKEGLKSLVKVPAVYAVVFGLLLSRTGVQMPVFLDRSISMLGTATVPAMLVLLGMQLAINPNLSKEKSGNAENALPTTGSAWSFRLPRTQILAFVSAIALRMIFAPLVTYFGAMMVGMQGPAMQAVLIESATPTAVMSTVLATEYDVEPSFMATVVFLTTILSPLTLTPLMALLGGH